MLEKIVEHRRRGLNALSHAPA